MKIDRTLLSLAGELSVASELCKRNIYAQLTFGHQKKVDLLAFKDENLIKIEVKSKQSNEWPGCKGINDQMSYIIFVDFKNKTELERPDFYILTFEDWSRFVAKWVENYKLKRPNRRIIIENSTPVFLDEVKNNQPYKGIGIRITDLSEFKEKWAKLTTVLYKNKE